MIIELDTVSRLRVFSENRIEEREIYVTASPCYNCFKMIANSGINKIYFGEFYRDENVIELAKLLDIGLTDLSK